jgi:hypothetical protein
MEKDIVYYYEFPIQSTIDKTQNKQSKTKTTQIAKKTSNTWQNHESEAI